jgi:hypothetical protein
MKYHYEINTKMSSGGEFRMTSLQAFDVLIPHVVATLPDSISRRQQVLAALRLCLPRNHRCAPLLRELQVHLDAHCRIQGRWTDEAASIEFHHNSAL